jgi:hypothetical protein
MFENETLWGMRKKNSREKADKTKLMKAISWSYQENLDSHTIERPGMSKSTN